MHPFLISPSFFLSQSALRSGSGILSAFTGLHSEFMVEGANSFRSRMARSETGMTRDTCLGLHATLVADKDEQSRGELYDRG